MSSGGEVAFPLTEHSVEILTGSWPSQTAMAWSGLALALKAEAYRLGQELESQRDISDILMTQSGEFIASAVRLAKSREYALMNRISMYEQASQTAHSASQEITDAKTDMVSIVNKAEEAIKKAREEAEKAKAAAMASPMAGAAIAAIEGALQGQIAGIVATAKGDAELRDAAGASLVGTYSTAIQNWNDPFINGLLGEPIPQAPALQPIPAAPAGMGNAPAPLDNNIAKPIDYTGLSDARQDAAPSESAAKGLGDQKTGAENNIQQAALRNDATKEAAVTPKEPAKPSMPSSPPSTASPSTGGSSGGSSASSPTSAIGSLMKPPSSSSPASSSASSPSSGMGGSGSPAGAHPSSALSSSGAPGAAQAAGATGSGAAGAGSRGFGAVSSGAGVAESALRMGSGAVSSAANVVGAGSNVASQVAHGAANAVSSASAAAAPGPAPSPAGATSPAGVAPGGGGGAGPVGMMPPPAAAGGGSVVGHGGSAVAPGSPNVPAAAPGSGGGVTSVGSTAVSSAGAGGSSGLVPAVIQGSPIRALGAADSSGAALVSEASEAGRAVLESVISQIRGLGLLNATWWSAAVSVFLERDGGATAWLATSDGPSYVPLGVRIPDDVGLAVRDPFSGRDLWERSATAGWSDPLEVLKIHAETRVDASPGSRPLVMASTWPLDRVQDWASQVGARAVSVDPRTIEAGSAGGTGQHRVAVAMPWDWQQAQSLSVDERVELAPRLAANAALSGGLSMPGCRQAIDLVEQGAELTASDWADVEREYQQASSAYDLSKSGISLTGGEAQAPEWTFRTARAAEAVLCLRNASTGEGFADLLYASRLAGAPLGVMTA